MTVTLITPALFSLLPGFVELDYIYYSPNYFFFLSTENDNFSEPKSENLNGPIGGDRLSSTEHHIPGSVSTEHGPGNSSPVVTSNGMAAAQSSDDGQQRERERRGGSVDKSPGNSSEQQQQENEPTTTSTTKPEGDPILDNDDDDDEDDANVTTGTNESHPDGSGDDDTDDVEMMMHMNHQNQNHGSANSLSNVPVDPERLKAFNVSSCAPPSDRRVLK